MKEIKTGVETITPEIALESKYDEQTIEQEMVEQFFSMLHGLKNATDTINTLRTKLINDLASERKMSPKYKAAVIAKTWNAYAMGKEIKVLSYNEAKEGVVPFK